MLRGIPSITATLTCLCTLAGCSAADPTEATATVQATTSVDPTCSHGGQSAATTVTLVSFDAATLELEAVNARGSRVVARLTPATVETIANLRTFPPDPIFPQCTDDATTYDRDLGAGATGVLTRALLSDLGQLASDGCDASVVLAADGTVTSFQPVP
ncbi:MAG TPA: hypothetical protein VGL81_14280 [Polyangiaceae bacterium]|jgi:hypothetical protein